MYVNNHLHLISDFIFCQEINAVFKSVDKAENLV